MDTILTLVFTFLTIGGAIFAINKTGSFFVGILVGIIIVMIWRSVKVPLLILWDRFAEKHFPLPAITHFYEEGLDGEMIGGLNPIQLGVRLLLITETLEYSEETKELFYIMADASKKALSEEYPLFELRSLAVEKRKSPVQFSSTLCGIDGEHFQKCVKAWNKTQAVHLMTSRVQNKDIFMYDGGLAVDGKVINYTAIYLFDSTLPVTVSVLEKVKQKQSEDAEDLSEKSDSKNPESEDSENKKKEAEGPAADAQKKEDSDTDQVNEETPGSDRPDKEESV